MQMIFFFNLETNNSTWLIQKDYKISIYVLVHDEVCLFVVGPERLQWALETPNMYCSGPNLLSNEEWRSSRSSSYQQWLMWEGKRETTWFSMGFFGFSLHIYKTHSFTTPYHNISFVIMDTLLNFSSVLFFVGPKLLYYK